jgi:hypothetical protein
LALDGLVIRCQGRGREACGDLPSKAGMFDYCLVCVQSEAAWVGGINRA